MNNIMTPEIKQNLIEQIKNSPYTQQKVKNLFLDLIEKSPNGFYGRHEKDHITASVLVIDEEHRNVLLTHHRKFDKWLQLGGHWMDGLIAEEVFNGGIREVFEEGYDNKPVPFKILNDGKPLDLDVHIAGNDNHYDICFIVEINKSIPFTVSSESKTLAWVDIHEILKEENYEARLSRMCMYALDVVAKIPKESVSNSTIQYKK